LEGTEKQALACIFLFHKSFGKNSRVANASRYEVGGGMRNREQRAVKKQWWRCWKAKDESWEVVRLLKQIAKSLGEGIGGLNKSIGELLSSLDYGIEKLTTQGVKMLNM
jgi:hypothetical protein